MKKKLKLKKLKVNSIKIKTPSSANQKYTNYTKVAESLHSIKVALISLNVFLNITIHFINQEITLADQTHVILVPGVMVECLVDREMEMDKTFNKTVP